LLYLTCTWLLKGGGGGPGMRRMVLGFRQLDSK
jgi:hypothetical protein